MTSWFQMDADSTGRYAGSAPFGPGLVLAQAPLGPGPGPVAALCLLVIEFLF